MNERILDKLQALARRLPTVTARLVQDATKLLREKRVNERVLETLRKLKRKMPTARQRVAAVFAKLPPDVKLCGGAVAVSVLIVAFAALLPRQGPTASPSEAQPEVAAASSASGVAAPQAAAFAPPPSPTTNDVLATRKQPHWPGARPWREVVAMTDDELARYFVLHGFAKVVRPKAFDTPDPRLAHLDPGEAEIMQEQLKLAEFFASMQRDLLAGGASDEEIEVAKRDLDVTFDTILPLIEKKDRDAIRDRALRTPTQALDNNLTASLRDDGLPLLQRLQNEVKLMAAVKRRTAALRKDLSKSAPLLRAMAGAFHRYPLAREIAELLSDAPPAAAAADQIERVASRLEKFDASGRALHEPRLSAFVDDMAAFLESEDQGLSRKLRLADRLRGALGSFAYHPHEYTTNIPPHIAARMRHAYAMACDDLGGIVKSRWTWPRDHLPATYEHWYRWATDRNGFYAGAEQLALDRDRFPPDAPQTRRLFEEFVELAARDREAQFLSADEVQRFNAPPPPAWP